MRLVYDGTKLTWSGRGAWNATSGLPGHQNSLDQFKVDKGPIPEGAYSVPLKLGKDASVTTYTTDRQGHVIEADLDTRSEIESLQCVQNPRSPGHILLFNEWGSNRVRLTKIRVKHPKAARRDGFYIHDSVKGYSHGCIEVDTAFFKTLRSFAKHHGKRQHTIQLTVDYGPDSLTSGVSTYGHTKKSGEVVMKCDA